MIGFALKCIGMLLAAVCYAGCTRLLPQQHTINAAYDVKVTDPVIKLFTDVTDNVNIAVSGEFRPGTYLLNKTPVTFAPDTQFKLKLLLPINDPGVIHTRDATGSLWTNSFRTVELQGA